MNAFFILFLAFLLGSFNSLKAQSLDYFKKVKNSRNYCLQEDTLNTTLVNNTASLIGKIDYIVVSKMNQKVFLFSGNKIVRIYPVVFGKNPIGAKQFEGDLKTPEGHYFIAEKNPESKYYKSLQISYPNKEESEYAHSQGKLPGSEIMFHGLPNVNANESIGERFKRIGITKAQSMGINWTRGCMAMTNENIDEMYTLISLKTLVEICPSQIEK
ncbi:MAG: L,D-transpeptidase [Bacteriovorax sp.]|jgi:murein L,D-transpeptidase YafK|nr:L,D-transpeptidase [Bacteriovorax sp.]